VNATIFQWLFNSRPRSIVSSGQLEANGPLIELPGGPARLAVGLDYTQLRFTGTSNRGTLAAPTHTVSSNSRDIWAAYAELFLPLVGPDNAFPGVRRLDVSLAGRIDDYSDVGTTSNPKIGVNWSPTEGLLLKASYGTSFKAPYLSDTLSTRSGASLTVNTTPDPLSPTGSSTGLQINDGRAGLVPEEATTYSFTAEWEPPFLPGFRASVTYFDLDYTGQIFAPVITNVLINPIWAGSVIRNPTPEQVQQVITETGLPIRGVLPARVDFIFDGRPQNLGGTEVNGFDFLLSYDRTTDFGDLFATVSGSYLTKYDLKVTPIAPAQNQLNKIYYPLQFRMRGEVGLQRGPWMGQVMANYANGYDNNLVTPEQSVDSWTTFDVRVSYSFDGGSFWSRDLEASLEISNIFDEDPPFVNVQGGMDPSATSAIGRMFTVTFSKRWW
jgi:iron complex outermembrane recepter protein